VVLYLLCSGISWADEVYQITESELIELETILTRQAETIERQRQTLTQLSETIKTQATTINELRISFDEYESGATQTIRRWQFATGVAVVVAILALVF
jgi:hypothetical protein